MLYKKCHRNFVKKFKKGTKVKYRYNDGTETIIGKVIIEPFIFMSYSSTTRIKHCWIEIELPDAYLKIIDDKGRKLTGKVEAVN